MNETCVACGAQIDAAATRCPSCGLAFDAAEAGANAAPPAHVGLYLGDVPRLVEGPGADFETPIPPPPARPPLDPRVRRRRIVVAVFVAALVAAGATVFVRTRRPDDAWTRHELDFERFLRSDGLRTVVPPPLDPDACLAEIQARDPNAARQAEETFRPLPPAATIHEFFDGFLSRFVELSPDVGLAFDVKPYPRGMVGIDDLADARRRVLCREAWRRLSGWPDAARLSPHDRADRDALSGWLESQLRRRGGDDVDRLNAMTEAVQPLMRLAEIHGDDVAARAAAASARLTALPEFLARAQRLLATPPRPLLVSTAETLDDADAWLAGYADLWRDAPDATVADLRSAVAPARVALRETAAALRAAAPAALPGNAVGREGVATLLAVRHRIPLDARTIYERAAEALRDAHDDMRRLLPEARAADVLPAVSDADYVSALREGVPQWTLDAPQDAGVEVSPMPRLWGRRRAGGLYVDPGRDPRAPGVVHVLDREPSEGFAEQYDVLARRETLAHESYPGHRLEALYRRDACGPRRFVDDRVFVEGWAVYAEGLVHETGRAATGPLAEYVRASWRAWRAMEAMISILLATGAASDGEILHLLHESGWARAADEDLGVRGAYPLHGLTYFLGREEIERLRRDEEGRLGGAFDLRAFHARLLSAGPIPTRLVEEEWRAAR